MSRIPCLFLLAGLVCASPVRGGEVAFKTVATTHSRQYASAGEGAYFGIFGGGTGGQSASLESRGRASLDYDGGTGLFVGAEMGYAWTTPYVISPAVELEGFYFGNEYTVDGSGGRLRDPSTLEGDLRSAVLMANFILGLDFGAGEPVEGLDLASLEPFIGAGLGAAYVWTDGPSVRRGGIEAANDNGVTWAWQLLTGLEVEMSDTFSIYGEYRYLVLNEVGKWASDHSSHLFGAGLRFKFD